MRKLYIHIGLPKTGTTAIQKWLYSHRDYLLHNHGILYPNAHLRYDHSEYALIFWEKEVKSEILGFLNMKEEILFNSLKAQIENPKCQAVILSSENFGEIPYDNLHDFHNFIDKLFPNFELNIVVYLRRQDEFIESGYKQMIKEPIWNLFFFFDSPLCICGKNHINFLFRLDLWHQIFHNAKIIVRIFPPNFYREEGFNVVEDFLNNVIGLNIEKNAFLAVHENPSLSWISTYALRKLNEKFIVPYPLRTELKEYLIMIDKENNFNKLLKHGIFLKEREYILEFFKDSNDAVFRKYLKSDNKFILTNEEKEYYRQEEEKVKNIKKEISFAIKDVYKRILKFLNDKEQKVYHYKRTQFFLQEKYGYPFESILCYGTCGWVDRISDKEIAGWIWEKGSSKPAEFQIKIRDTIVYEGVCSFLREDITSEVPTGFSVSVEQLKISESVIKFVPYYATLPIRVVHKASGGIIPGNYRDSKLKAELFGVKPKDELKGWLDLCNLQNGIAGWMLDYLVEGPTDFQIKFNDYVVYEGKTDVYRSDIVDIYGVNFTAGFHVRPEQLTLPQELLSLSPDTLSQVRLIHKRSGEVLPGRYQEIPLGEVLKKVPHVEKKIPPSKGGKVMSRTNTEHSEEVKEVVKSKAIVPAGFYSLDNRLMHILENHKGKVLDKWERYIYVYDRLFREFLDREIRILEIGVQNGGSLEVWAEYFQNAKEIVGCDIDPKCGELKFEHEHVKVVVCDATKPECVEKIQNITKEFDIIIDDANHYSQDIIKTFLLFFPLLKEGGIYIIEDLHVSYWKNFMNKQNIGGLNNPLSALSFLKRLIDVINRDGIPRSNKPWQILKDFISAYNLEIDPIHLTHIESIEFTNSLAIIKKSNPSKNLLGRRLVKGAVETVTQNLKAYDGTSLMGIMPDEEEDTTPTHAEALEIISGLERLTKELTEEREGLRSQLELLQREKTETQAHLLDLQGRLSELEQELQTHKQARENLISEIQTLQERLNHLVAEREDLLRQLEAIQQERGKLLANLSNLSTENEELSESLSLIEQEKERLQSQLTDMQNKLSEMEREKLSLTTLLSETQTTVNAYQQQISDLEKQNQNLTQQLGEAHSTLQGLQNQVSLLQKENQAFKNEIDRLRQENSELNREKGILVMRLNKIKNSVSWKIVYPIRAGSRFLKRLGLKK